MRAMLAPSDALAKRSRVASIDVALLDHVRRTVARQSEPTTVRFNLFDDVSFVSTIERTAPTFSGGYSLLGHTVEDPPGNVTLVKNGETVAGIVRTLTGTYRIRSAGEGVLAIVEVDESKTPLDCQADVAP